jgi:hypothetical protein
MNCFGRAGGTARSDDRAAPVEVAVFHRIRVREPIRRGRPTMGNSIAAAAPPGVDDERPSSW